MSSENQKRVGLVLSGGGARGAYQAGVIKGVAEIAADAGIQRPVPIITGISAGAINAAYLASRADNFLEGATHMAQMWSELTADRIFKTDALTAGRSGFRLFTDATIGAFYKKKLAKSLLDTAPLRQLLDERIQFDRIQHNIENGHLDALSITAMNFTNSNSTAFIQAHPDTPMWARSRRTSEFAKITTPHVLASAALPLFFPPVRVDNDHFGDGCLRNNAPLSPAIHLGADRLLVISVRKPDSRPAHAGPGVEPSLARVLGTILNALILDAVDVDMERLSRINQTLELIPDTYRNGSALRRVDFLWVRPSKDIGQLAGENFEKLPKVIKYLIRGLGSSKEASELTSYLLFDPDFCGQLVTMGYEDAKENSREILAFLKR